MAFGTFNTVYKVVCIYRLPTIMCCGSINISASNPFVNNAHEGGKKPNKALSWFTVPSVNVTLHCQSFICTWVFKQNIIKPTAGSCLHKLLFSNSLLRKPLSQLTGNDTVHWALTIITFSEVQNRNISLFLFPPLASKDSFWKLDLPRNSLCSLLKQTSNMCVRIKNAILQSHYGEKGWKNRQAIFPEDDGFFPVLVLENYS